MKQELTLEQIGILDAFEDGQTIQYKPSGTNSPWHTFPLPHNEASVKELEKRIKDGLNEYRVKPSIKPENRYKYLVGMSIYTDEITSPGIDWESVYDTLEDAQQGIRDSFDWEERYSKEIWNKNGITYTKHNFTFNTIEPGLENNDVALALIDVRAVVNFVNNDGRKWDWEYSIYTIPYKVDYSKKKVFPWE